jgi:hypothetical protein
MPKPRIGGCADALKTVDVTNRGGSMFLRLPGNTIGRRNIMKARKRPLLALTSAGYSHA